jgi:hypothetical protein
MKELEEIQKCSCYKCTNILTTFTQYTFGICEPHLKMLLNKNYYIGLCWNCGAITDVGDRQHIIKDKYIFAKGCKNCGHEEHSNQWMTLNTNTSKQLSEFGVDHNGSIIFIIPNQILK